MAYWACAQLQHQRQALALGMLVRAGFEVYSPRLREWRVGRGGRRQKESALFPGYCFLLVQLQWRHAHYCPGVIRLVMNGLQPAGVPDVVIEEIRVRERNGAIELPRRSLKPGDQVRILSGPFHGHCAIFVGMKPRARVEALLSLLGVQTRVTLRVDDVEALPQS